MLSLGWLPSRRLTYRFGHPPRAKVGDVFRTREELRKAGVHATPRAGIHGQRDCGAFSIVMSGVYEDDIDCGDRILYVGTGGLETPEEEGPQVADQTFEHSMNKSLLTSINTRNPVRVIRGSKLRSPFAPGEGFRYDGLYTVETAEMKKGKSGFQVCVFELKRLPGQPPIRRTAQPSPNREPVQSSGIYATGHDGILASETSTSFQHRKMSGAKRSRRAPDSTQANYDSRSTDLSRDEERARRAPKTVSTQTVAPQRVETSAAQQSREQRSQLSSGSLPIGSVVNSGRQDARSSTGTGIGVSRAMGSSARERNLEGPARANPTMSNGERKPDPGTTNSGRHVQSLPVVPHSPAHANVTSSIMKPSTLREPSPTHATATLANMPNVRTQTSSSYMPVTAVQASNAQMRIGVPTVPSSPAFIPCHSDPAVTPKRVLPIEAEPTTVPSATLAKRRRLIQHGAYNSQDKRLTGRTSGGFSTPGESHPGDSNASRNDVKLEPAVGQVPQAPARHKSDVRNRSVADSTKVSNPPEDLEIIDLTMYDSD
ncbi:hypothetical protein GY45DRAFT_1326586 [Cubamyces sp. BRFM 1775]|nr:hypothetical protein GY45DRAFT_1326586 [Cubamyces sp. BRFM 1775]